MPRSNDVMQSSMRSPSRRPNTTAENMHERTSPGLLRSNESSRHWRDPSSRTDMSGNSSGNHHRPHLSKVTDHPRTSDLSLDSVANLSLSLNPEEGSAAPYHSKYDWRLHSLTLCRHIFTQGLLEGIGSDIIVHVPAWEKTYQLHRLVLDQNPYFRLLLHGGFRETSSDSIVLNFEKNQYITAESFYFVLTRLYGKLFDPDITQENVRQILATCSFFQLQHMCDLCVDYILKILDEHNFMEYLTFCDEILVHSSDRICDAIFTYLCREVYTMDRKKVAAVPVRWLKKVIESDAFWVPSEYERYQFAYQVLTIYYKHYCANGTPEDHKGTALDGDQKDDGGSTSECTTVVTNPDEQVLVTRSVSTDTADGLQKRSSFAPSPLTTDPTVSDEEKTDETENTDDEAESIEPFSLKDLEIYNEMLCQSIHYIHMTFEQLESIGKDINPFTNERVVPEHVLKDALWHQIQMRTKIESASERHSELGLIVSPSAEDKTNSRSTKCNADTSSVTKKDIFYLIPADDTTTYTGESALSWTTSATSFESKCSDAAKPGVEKDEGCTGRATTDQYTIYPPFRFSVEFSDISTLRHGVRVYSKTVFYAGSNWNMYIQKTRSQRKGIMQLGVYLHRQSVPYGSCNRLNESSSSETTSSFSGTATQQHNNKRSGGESSSFSRYTDRRKVVRTWFKIFSPLRGPKHMLTLFQSSPDNFSVLQSWGWRSTTLCVDELLANAASSTTSGGGVGTNDNGNHGDNNPISSQSSPPPPLHATTPSLYSPILPPNPLQYHQSSHEIRPSGGTKSAGTLSSTNAKASTPTTGSTLRFSVVMGHI